MQNCPLCNGLDNELFFENKIRKFYLCDNCGLIFVPKEFHLTAEEEKNEYDLHDNDVNDVYYRKFLNRLATPVLEKLSNKLNKSMQPKGLDFGCGFAPALAAILEENGCEMAKYDRFYFDDKKVFKENYYDFITTTEVAEHLSQPMKEFQHLWNCLKKENNKSFLAVMTKLVNEDAFVDKKIFANWHYIRDLTHICFFSKRSCEYIAQKLTSLSINQNNEIEIEFIGNDIVIFTLV